jgi:hypothetical protein
MLERLNRRVEEIGTLQSKLLLLGAQALARPRCCATWPTKRGMDPVLNAGVALGARLAALPQKQRHLQAAAFCGNWPASTPKTTSALGQHRTVVRPHAAA